MRQGGGVQRKWREVSMCGLARSVPPARGEARIRSSASARDLCVSVYLPPQTEAGWRLESLLGVRECRFFSYGRRALVEALRVSGVTKGQMVALPGLICRELVSAVHAVGAIPRFYRIGEDLNLASPATGLPSCEAVVAVNYFGFPQEFAPFQDHCRRTGAVLIEDNAHGLFSRDAAGTFLGMRGDIGIFSLRKTLPLPNGAALVVNTRGRAFPLGPQQPFDSGLPSLKFRLKQFARRVAPVVGCWNLHRFLALVRRLNWGAESLPVTQGDRADEWLLPEPERPCAVLSQPLRADIGRETARRCVLYEWLDGWLREAGLAVTPVFPSLPDFVVPYGYPFYADHAEFPKVRAALGAHGLDALSWPDLPGAVRVEAPTHYTTLRLIPFLW